MGFMLGSPCSPCCGCQPCPRCSPSCLTATFSGFSHGTANCNECSFLDGTTFQLKRPGRDGSNHWLYASVTDSDGPDEGTAASGSGASLSFAGVSFNGTMTNMARRENGSFYVTSVIINNGGSGYDQPIVAFTTADFYVCRPASATLTVTSGVITAVTVTDGGEYWLPNVCEYQSDSVCSVCSDNYGGKLEMSLSLGATNHTMTVIRRASNNVATTLLSASRSSVDGNGNAITCTGLTFDPEHFSEQYSCMTNGTVTIAQGECGDSSQSGCEVPEQVSISASGVPLIFGHSGAYGGSVSGSYVPGLAEHCGIEGYCTISTSQGGGMGGAANISLISRDESGVILDGGRNEFCGIGYSGVLPDLPTGGANSGFVVTLQDCGGSLSGLRGASLTIIATTAFTSVTISPPSWGSYGATAEASVGGGQVTGITITNPGEGYAREIFTRTEPEMTVTLSGGTGSGATLAATLTQSGTGESATWGVDSVSVTNGGTGYAGNETVVFTPETGSTADYPASAYIVTGRVEPTVTASVSGGSGASLSVTLGQSTDWNGLDIWSVSSVAVNNGGTGYADGASVTFTVTDGTQVYGASATISTVRSQPDVTASLPYSSGSGAVLSPSLSASGDSWTVSSVAITNGGSGYSQWDQVLISTTDVEAAGSYLYVSSVDGTGAITGIGISQSGSYYRDTGVVDSVNVSWGGEYYKSTGVIESVVISEPGAYYIAESTGTSQVDTPTVTIGSNAGEGATATATVDGTVGSETFGQITGISVTNGGSGYLAALPIWQATLNYDGLSHASVSDRVTTDHCPTALLNRSYAMSLSVISIPGLFGNGCGNADAVTSNGNGTNTYRFDGITISVSAA